MDHYEMFQRMVCIADLIEGFEFKERSQYGFRTSDKAKSG
jgi:hypothetical protein